MRKHNFFSESHETSVATAEWISDSIESLRKAYPKETPNVHAIHIGHGDSIIVVTVSGALPKVDPEELSDILGYCTAAHFDGKELWFRFPKTKRLPGTGRRWLRFKDAVSYQNAMVAEDCLNEDNKHTNDAERSEFESDVEAGKEVAKRAKA